MRRVILTAMWCASLAACHGAPATRDDRRGSDNVGNSADRMPKNPEGLASGFQDLAKGLAAMARGGDPNATPVEPLSIDALIAALPALPGWERGKPTGERMNSPVNYAEAQVTFRKSDAQITQKIVDSALNPILIAPFTMFLAVGYEKQTENGYERGIKIGDYPGWEKWNGEERDGELNAIIDKRFIVQIEGQNVENIKVLHSVMDRMNLAKLAGLK